MLYHNGCLWTERNNTEFNIQWVHLILPEHASWSGFSYCGYYDFYSTLRTQDDSVILLRKASSGNVDRSRKELIKLFKDHELKISTTTNANVISFLDVTLNLSTGNYRLYTKDLHN